MSQLWPSVMVQFSLTFYPFATDYANQVPPPLPICTFLFAGFTQGTWFHFPIMPVASPLGVQPCWVLKPIPPHVTCSRSPASIVSLMPPLCCGFLTPKDFFSVISSLALYQLKNVLSSTSKFLEPEEGGIVAWAFNIPSWLWNLYCFHNLKIYISFLPLFLSHLYSWKNYLFCFS